MKLVGCSKVFNFSSFLKDMGTLKHFNPELLTGYIRAWSHKPGKVTVLVQTLKARSLDYGLFRYRHSHHNEGKQVQG